MVLFFRFYYIASRILQHTFLSLVIMSLVLATPSDSICIIGSNDLLMNGVLVILIIKPYIKSISLSAKLTILFLSNMNIFHVIINFIKIKYNIIVHIHYSKSVFLFYIHKLI